MVKNENKNFAYTTHRIGGTTYKVKVVFNEDGTETMEDKILRMIRNEVHTNCENYDIINTESPVFLDFSRVRGFFVTNLLLVQCSNAVLLYFYGYILFHLFISIYAP